MKLQADIIRDYEKSNAGIKKITFKYFVEEAKNKMFLFLPSKHTINFFNQIKMKENRKPLENFM